MGLVRLGSLDSYWSTQRIYNMKIPQSIMSRNRFQLLLKMLHFANNETIQQGDRLGKIQPLIDMLQRKFKSLYYPNEDIVIDETLIPWRGRLVFRQYIPNKTHRYGIKLFKLCSTSGYTWALKVYAGKSATGVHEIGLAKKVCLSLCQGLLYEGRTLYVDNFYTTYELARELLESHTHLIGTVRAKRKDFPKEVDSAKLKRGEIVSKEDQHGITFLKWRDTRDVRLVSTKHSPIMVEIPPKTKSRYKSSSSTDHDQPLPSTSTTDALPNLDQTTTSTNVDAPSTSTDNTANESPSSENQPKKGKKRGRKSKRATSKPLAVLAYNKGKSGIDLSDQMGSYATTLRKGIKWFRNLGMELILGIGVVNAWCLYKEVAKKKFKFVPTGKR